MTHAWADAIVRASWQGALLVLLVLLVACSKRASAATKSWLWLLASLKFLFVLCFLVELPVLPHTQRLTTFSPAAERSVTFEFSGVAPQPFDWTQIVFAAWLAGVSLFVARAVYDHRKVKRIVAESFEPDARSLEAWRVCGTPCRLRVHPDAPSPMLVGLARPVVVLPEHLPLELSDEELRMVLEHEAAHVRRHDAYASLCVFVSSALFFFHPAAWLAKHEWQVHREAACDAEAIKKTRVQPRDYAEMLVKVSATCGRSPLLALSAVPTFRTLQRRINDMKNTSNTRKGGVAWPALVLLVATGALPVVLVQRKPTFGSGVFQTQPPQVKVTQDRKPSTELAIARPLTTNGVQGLPPTAVTVPSTAALTTTQGVAAPLPTTVTVQGAYAPGSTATIAPGLPASTVSTGPVVAGQATSVSTGPITQGLPTTNIAPGQGTAVISGSAGVARPSNLAPGQGVATAGSAGSLTTSSGGVLTTQGRASEMTTLAEPVKTSGIPAPQGATSVTMVLRDNSAKDGVGLDKLINAVVENVEITDFLKMLSRVSGTKIAVEGVRSGMRIKAEIEGVTLGEVLGTIARIYNLEWRLESNGSITVRPFKG